MKTQWLIGGILIAVLSTLGCAKKPVASVSAVPAPTVVSAATGTPGATAGQKPAERYAPATGTASRPAPNEFVTASDLQDIHFDFDKYAIRPRDAQALDGDARWLRANPRDLLLIEGHCDERGTGEYNLALGDRRATAAMNYLVAQGISERRITIISYGKERPLCREHDEACWSTNRRAHFLVKHG
jgi:peptidoglycan-associated lipoprotein